VTHTEDDDDKDERGLKLTLANIGAIVRAVAYAAIILAAYFKLESRLDLLEYRIASNEKSLTAHTDTDVQLQSEIDDILRFEAAENSQAGRPLPPLPSPKRPRISDQGAIPNERRRIAAQ